MSYVRKTHLFYVSFVRLIDSCLLELGSRIDEERRALEMSTAQFAAAIQISERQYRRIIRNGADISSDTLLRICQVTGRDPNYFLLPTGGVTQSAELNPRRLRRLLSLPPWAFQTANLVLRELEKYAAKKSQGRRATKISGEPEAESTGNGRHSNDDP